MRSEWSLQNKMMSLLVAFGIIPLCVMSCLLLTISWKAYVSDTVKRNEYVLENIEADAHMLMSQTESVIRALAATDSLNEMLSSRTAAEWTISYKNEVLLELRKAELYLSSLNANIMLIFNREEPFSEHWYWLLKEERFLDDEAYCSFVESKQYDQWYGMGNPYPTSLSHVYDYRDSAPKFAYYCRVSSDFNRSFGVIKCAIDAQPFITSALQRANENPLYIRSNERMLYAADDQYSEEAFALLRKDGSYRWDGSMWQRRLIGDMELEVAIRIGFDQLVLEYISNNFGTLLLTVLAIFLLFFVAQRVLRSLLARINRMAVVADSINAKEGRVHLPEDGEDEVGRVVRAFNSLFDRLDAQMAETMGKEKAKRHMQALALQYQLNPHFLFNSLLWLQMELEEQNIDPRISNNITKLASVLRYNLSESLQSTLAQEAVHLQAYIDFMCEMKKQKISLALQWDPALNDVAIPRFMLQPLVENALQHGLIYGLDMTICVSAQSDGSSMQFRIANNGREIQPEQLAKLRETLVQPAHGIRGVGISNLVQRLRLMYADRYSIEVESDAKETVFKICIPRENQPAAAAGEAEPT